MKICLVCSDGGHLTELLLLQEAFAGHETFTITYDGPRTRGRKRVYTVANFTQSKLRYFLDIPKMFFIIIKERPSLIVSTGAEIACPIFYFSKLLGIRNIYIETLTRIKEPSGTGKIVYPVTDVFLVQWEELLSKYGKKARYWGRVF
jgi:UDP-N-acetylglucosamine:LPS N-acetylglucosamine transferase